MVVISKELELKLAGERARGDVIDEELSVLGERLRPVADMGGARHLSFAIVRLLLDTFTCSLGREYDAALAMIEELLALAMAAAVKTHSCGEQCERADRMAARLFSKVGPGGTWGFELQIPYDLARLLRMACEADAWRYAPLVVREARAMLIRHRLGTSPVDDLVSTVVAQAVGART